MHVQSRMHGLKGTTHFNAIQGIFYIKKDSIP